MTLNDATCDSIRLLLLFSTDSRHQGLKLHQDADPGLLDAARRLHQLGVIDKPDGGYLTEFGHELSDNAQRLVTALNKA